MTKQTAIKKGYKVTDIGQVICYCGKPLLNKKEQEVWINIKII